MLIGLIVLALLISVPLLGGRLLNLAELRFAAPQAIVAAIILQVAIVSVVPGGSPLLHRGVHLVSYALAGWFVVANRRLPGVLLVAAGGASNLVAITANGGVMPAAPRALRIAGLPLHQAAFLNSTAVRHPHVQLLGDVIPTPPGFPLPNVYSIGDVLLLLGALVLLHGAGASRPARALAARFGRPRVQVVATGWAQDLVRVRTAAAPDARALIVRLDGREQRALPLPCPPGPVVAFAVPSRPGAQAAQVLALEVGGRRVALGRAERLGPLRTAS